MKKYKKRKINKVEQVLETKLMTMELKESFKNNELRNINLNVLMNTDLVKDAFYILNLANIHTAADIAIFKITHQDYKEDYVQSVVNKIGRILELLGKFNASSSFIPLDEIEDFYNNITEVELFLFLLK